MTERDRIKAVQKLLAEMKEHLREIEKTNKDAGRAAAANATFLARAKLNVWHGEAAKDLLEHFPDFAADIVLLGPGGR